MESLVLTKSILGSLYIAAMLICVLFSTLLLKSNLPSRHYLLTFLAIKVGIVCCEWLVLHTNNPSNWFWLSLLIVLSFCLAPLLYRFAKEIAGHPEGLRFNHWEWAIGVFATVLMIPLFLASQVFIEFHVSPWFGRFIHITMSMCIVVFAVQVAFYWSKALRIYQTEKGRIKTFSSSLKKASLRILKVLLVLVLTHWLVGLLRSINVWFWQSQIEIVIAFNLIEYCVLLAGMFFMFHGSLYIVQNQDKETGERQLPEDKTAKSANTGQPTKKYLKTPLSETHKKRIADKLLDQSLVSPLACSSDISLNKFAEALGEKPYYVSQVFSQTLHTNFYEFVTDLRIKLVTQQLSKPSDMSILEIAYMAGFNSKSSFNTAFKSRVGITPSKFRAAEKRGQQIKPT